jgi:phosphoenolpyruvate synthase/pyruvate phosphate dikinase
MTSAGAPTAWQAAVRAAGDSAYRLAPGEILVTATTTPAWTPLFSRGAIATDGGSLVAHASLTPRDYGIPAVVALGDTTRRARDGQRRKYAAELKISRAAYRNRTDDLRITSASLWPTELRRRAALTDGA